MANIPIERTSGTPWWLWLLGLLLLAGLIWFLLEAFGDDDDDVDLVDDTEVVDDDIAVAPLPEVDATALDMSNLYVTRVVGDRTFFVAPSEAMADQETLVILDQNMSPGAPGVEGQVDINPGQRVAFTDGSMEALGDVDLADMGVPPADRDGMTASSQVIRVDGGDVEILEADMDNVEVDA